MLEFYTLTVGQFFRQIGGILKKTMRHIWREESKVSQGAQNNLSEGALVFFPIQSPSSVALKELWYMNTPSNPGVISWQVQLHSMYWLLLKVIIKTEITMNIVTMWTAWLQWSEFLVWPIRHLTCPQLWLNFTTCITVNATNQQDSHWK